MPNPKRPTLTIDLEEFEHLLAACDGTDEEKHEYLQLIWDIVCEFAMIGFHIHPVQQAKAEKICGQDENKPCSVTHADSDALDSTLVAEFSRAVDADTKKEEDAYA